MRGSISVPASTALRNASTRSLSSLAVCGRHFDHGQFLRYGGRVLLNRLIEHAVPDEDENSHGDQHEQRQHAGDDAAVEEASALAGGGSSFSGEYLGVW